jgi:hypothetical protein
MIAHAELQALPRVRLEDAKALLAAERFDAAVYLCGYGLELALKSRICRTLNWPAFPESQGEFKSLMSFKTHDLDVLLRLSGVESEMRANHLADWSAVQEWNSELRYRTSGSVTESDAVTMIGAIERLMGVL